uniref:(northern house mosquito) hypothetical protein n=1 Tax=Culex pipiens TaxID=7175 RepID=A0A8D8A7D3_CULPI
MPHRFRSILQLCHQPGPVEHPGQAVRSRQLQLLRDRSPHHPPARRNRIPLRHRQVRPSSPDDLIHLHQRLHPHRAGNDLHGSRSRNARRSDRDHAHLRGGRIRRSHHGPGRLLFRSVLHQEEGLLDRYHANRRERAPDRDHRHRVQLGL